MWKWGFRVKLWCVAKDFNAVSCVSVRVKGREGLQQSTSQKLKNSVPSFKIWN